MFGIAVNMLWRDRNTLIFDHHTDMDRTLWFKVINEVEGVHSLMNAYLRNNKNNMTSYNFWSKPHPGVHKMNI